MNRGVSLKAGDAFFAPAADIHLWLVLSDPIANPRQVIMVSFTSWTLQKDQACIIEVGEHRFIKKRTCVAYDEARIAPISALMQVFRQGQLEMHDPVSPQLLERMRKSAAKSRIKLEYLEILEEQGLI